MTFKIVIIRTYYLNIVPHNVFNCAVTERLFLKRIIFLGINQTSAPFAGQEIETAAANATKLMASPTSGPTVGNKRASSTSPADTSNSSKKKRLMFVEQKLANLKVL